MGFLKSAGKSLMQAITTVVKISIFYRKAKRKIIIVENNLAIKLYKIIKSNLIINCKLAYKFTLNTSSLLYKSIYQSDLNLKTLRYEPVNSWLLSINKAILNNNKISKMSFSFLRFCS